MSRTFQQTVEFRGSTPEALFAIYLDSEKHAAAIGAAAWIEPRVGGRFKIFGEDAVRGTNLAIVPGRLIVQAWRGEPWQESDLDSIVILSFHAIATGARLDLVHSHVPDEASGLVNERAWMKMYWKPWHAYLADRTGSTKRVARR